MPGQADATFERSVVQQSWILENTVVIVSSWQLQ